ncbi:MAG: DUF222 domain-containing protein [Actinomycetes bacterium]
MSDTPGSAASPGLKATEEVLALVGRLLDCVDHSGRSRLSPDARIALVEGVVTIARRVEALRAVLVGEADRAKAAETSRGTSVRSMLTSSGQVSAGEAAGWVYAGRDIGRNPGVADAALAGEVSVGQARAIDGVLGELPAALTSTQRSEAERVLLDKARRMDAKALAGQTRAVLETVAPQLDAVEHELGRLDSQRRQAVAARAFTLVRDGRGSMLLRGQLPILEAAGLEKLLACYAESDRRARENALDRLDPLAQSRTGEQRRADALIAIVAAHTDALASLGLSTAYEPPTDRRTSAQPASDDQAGESDQSRRGSPAPHSAHASGTPGSLGTPGTLGKPSTPGTPDTSGTQGTPDTPACSCQASPAAPIAGTGSSAGPVSASRRRSRLLRLAGDRPRVVVTMAEESLRARAEQAGLLTDGQPISAGELRRLCCDADLVPAVLGGNSELLDVGRAQRLVTPEIRRALTLRDGGCSFPGCAVPDPACEAHHIVPWWAGGPTSLNNLVTVCPHHHGTIEPLRFFDKGSAPRRWQVRIAEDGHPEFSPPSRNGAPTPPLRHQRTLQRLAASQRPPTPTNPADVKANHTPHPNPGNSSEPPNPGSSSEPPDLGRSSEPPDLGSSSEPPDPEGGAS